MLSKRRFIRYFYYVRDWCVVSHHTSRLPDDMERHNHAETFVEQKRLHSVLFLHPIYHPPLIPCFLSLAPSTDPTHSYTPPFSFNYADMASLTAW